MPGPWEKYGKVESPGPWQKYQTPAASTATAPKPSATLRSAETGVGPWLEDVEHDIRGGGSRTVIGRGLGRLQGRGARGYSGLESGVSPETADFMGSVPLGMTKVAQGIVEIPKHPVRGVGKVIGGALQTATIPSAFAGGPIASKAVEAIPSAEYAGYLLQSVERDAGHLPVDLKRSADAILRVKELADRGGTMPQAIRKLLARATEPGGKSLTFSEMRDFYSNITRLSAKEQQGLTPVVRRQLGITAAALKLDIGDAAQQAGRAADYYKGLKEYASAAKLQRTAQELGKWAIRAAGVGATAALAKLIWNVTPKAPAGIRQ